jgi:hypothetical protein
MRRLPSIFVVIWLLISWPAAVHAATVSISNNHNNFGQGDNLTTTISVAHSGSPVAADFYLVLVLPDQTLVFFEYNNGFVPHIATADPSTWVKAASNITLPDGFDSGEIPLFSYTMSGAEEPGTYQWIMAATLPGTLNIIDLKTAPFFVSPGPVEALIGKYNVSTELPSLGGSGTAILEVADGSPGMLTISANGNSSGYTASFTGTARLSTGGGAALTMQADIFGTQVQGSGLLDSGGNISGTINVLSVGPFIQAITDVSGTFSNGVIRSTETIHYTDGTSGTESLTAIHQ